MAQNGFGNCLIYIVGSNIIHYDASYCTFDYLSTYVGVYSTVLFLPKLMDTLLKKVGYDLTNAKLGLARSSEIYRLGSASYQSLEGLLGYTGILRPLSCKRSSSLMYP